jgi:hypothetical protein
MNKYSTTGCLVLFSFSGLTQVFKQTESTPKVDYIRLNDNFDQNSVLL